MSEDPVEPPRPALTAEDRRRLAHDATRAVRLLAESLEQAGEDPAVAADAASLLERVQAAVEPLRPAVELVSPSSVGAPTMRVTTSRGTSWSVLAPVRSEAIPTGTASGTWGFQGTAVGRTPPEQAEVSAEDVPMLLAEMADSLRDLVENGRSLSATDVLQWAMFAMAYLSLLIQVLDR